MSTKDFDQYWQEQKEEQNKEEKDTFEFTVEGEKFETKSKLPAGLVIEGMRMQKEYDSEDEVPESKMIDILEQLLGKDQFEKLLDTGINFEKLAGLVEWLMKKLAGQEETEVDKGN